MNQDLRGVLLLVAYQNGELSLLNLWNGKERYLIEKIDGKYKIKQNSSIHSISSNSTYTQQEQVDNDNNEDDKDYEIFCTEVVHSKLLNFPYILTGHSKGVIRVWRLKQDILSFNHSKFDIENQIVQSNELFALNKDGKRILKPITSICLLPSLTDDQNSNFFTSCGNQIICWDAVNFSIISCINVQMLSTIDYFGKFHSQEPKKHLLFAFQAESQEYAHIEIEWTSLHPHGNVDDPFIETLKMNYQVTYGHQPSTDNFHLSSHYPFLFGSNKNILYCNVCRKDGISYFNSLRKKGTISNLTSNEIFVFLTEKQTKMISACKIRSSRPFCAMRCSEEVICIERYIDPHSLLYFTENSKTLKLWDVVEGKCVFQWHLQKNNAVKLMRLIQNGESYIMERKRMHNLCNKAFTDVTFLE